LHQYPGWSKNRIGIWRHQYPPGYLIYPGVGMGPAITRTGTDKNFVSLIFILMDGVHFAEYLFKTGLWNQE
jgi:hypothetical protein